jgi:hypothetical protein
MVVVGTAIACYLVLTLTSTGLAKLTRLADFASSLARDLRVSYRRARAVGGAVCFAELLLAVAVVTRVAPALTAITLVVMLTGFTGYRVWVFARTRAAVCWCAGQRRAVESSWRAVVSSSVANLTMVALAVVWAIVMETAGRGGSDWRWGASCAAPPVFVLAAARLRDRVTGNGRGPLPRRKRSSLPV